MTSQHNKVFTYSGLLTVGITYAVLLIVLILSFVFIHFATSLFIGLLCALTVICALIALIIYLSSRHVAKVDNTTKAKLKKGDFQSPQRGGF